MTAKELINKILNEDGAGLVTSADFWSNGVTQLVRFNNEEMPLKKFILNSEKNEEIKSVIEAIKKHKNYEGSVGGFILNYLKSKDRVMDIMIKKNGVYFDNAEIFKNTQEKRSRPT